VSLITIAGSGPSTREYNKKVQIATKKRSVPSDYIFCRFAFHYNRWGDEKLPLMLYYRRCTCGKCQECNTNAWYCDQRRWDKYYKQFTRSSRPPQRAKPSLGLCAVFGAVERWSPTEIGLIGYDWILDGNPTWEHDAAAEKECIESLVKVVDLRLSQDQAPQ
jgi:hypothetical protein